MPARTESNSRINGTEIRPWSAESLAGPSKPSKLLVFNRVTQVWIKAVRWKPSRVHLINRICEVRVVPFNTFMSDTQSNSDMGILSCSKTSSMTSILVTICSLLNQLHTTISIRLELLLKFSLGTPLGERKYWRTTGDFEFIRR